MSTVPARRAESIAKERSPANAPRRRAAIVTAGSRSSRSGALDRERPDLRSEDLRLAHERDRRARIDLRAEEERGRVVPEDRLVVDATRGGAAAAPVVRHGQRELEAGRHRSDVRDPGLEGPDAGEDEAADK